MPRSRRKPCAPRSRRAQERQVHAKRSGSADVSMAKVTLTGAVRSRAEHDAVIVRAWGNARVETVIDQLQ